MMKSTIKHPGYTLHFCGSMFPMLQNRDILEITSAKQIQKGDIVLFRNEENKQWVAHRVVKIEKEHIYTKGDNSKYIDSRALYLDEISGVVTARWRNSKKLTVYRGRKALFQYYFYLVYAQMRNMLKRGIGNASAPKAIPPIVYKLLPKPKEALFYKTGKEKKMLYIGRIHIGSYSERERCWQIKFPYRLLYGKYINVS